MKKPFFIFCLMFWAFAAGAYSQYLPGKAAGAVYKAVKAASNFKPPVVPTIPPKPVIVPSRPVPVPKIVVPSVPVPVTVYDTIIRKDFHLRVDSVTGGVVLDTVEYSYVIPSVKWVDPKSLIKEAVAESPVCRKKRKALRHIVCRFEGCCTQKDRGVRTGEK